MNRYEVARDALTRAIAPVLSGRTWPYPPSQQQAAVAPAVWIDQCDGYPSTLGERSEVWVAVFPVHVVYDGADRAQVAGLDEILSGIHDAVAHVPGARVAGVRAQLPEPGSTRRGSVVSVEYMITASTFCLPDVGGDVIHGASDVVEGPGDVVFHGPIHADTPPGTAGIPAADGEPVAPPDLVTTPQPEELDHG